MPSATEIRDLIVASLDDDKADDIVVIDLGNKSGFADFMIVASGRSDRHVGALADHLVEKLKASGIPSVPVEGMDLRDWVLLDAGDIIVHLFKPETRGFYNLEKLWTDGPTAESNRPVELIA